MSQETLRVEQGDHGIATLIIDRQDKHNALTVAMRNDIQRLLRELGAGRAVRVVIIRGAGQQAFCAGGDIAEFLTLGPRDLLLWGAQLSAPEEIPQPVIAAIDGYCLGAGLELALACDFRIATTRSTLGLPEIRLGMMPGSGGTQRMVRLIGLARTKQLIMRGQRVTARDAEAHGLVHQVVPPEEFDPAVDALARELAAFGPLALGSIKQVLNQAPDCALETGLEMERKAYAMLRSTRDYEEGIRAFFEKRPPVFTGE
ncbi:MAG: enoyl-CoA hydratase/isomerase family protein [Armatimonadota bacterium]